MKGKNEAQSAQSQRLKKLIQSLGISTSQFAREIGRRQPYISRVENGHVGISSAILSAITKRYSYVNTRWILTGEGEMFFLHPDESKQVKEPTVEYTLRGMTIAELEGTIIALNQDVSKLKKDIELLSARLDEIERVATEV